MASKVAPVWLSGLHSVEETLKARPRSVRELLIEHGSKNAAISDLVRRARQAGARVRFVQAADLARLAGAGHQGVAVLVTPKEPEGLGGFVAGLSEADKKTCVLVALDQIQDPQNLGAIARSAVNLGASGLIIPERRAAPVTPAAVQASAGAIQKIRVFSVVNLSQTLISLKERGFWVYGADMNGGAAWDAVIGTPLVLVIGSEGEGLRPLVRENCDAILSVPQVGDSVESLNASCAASVLLYEIARRRQPRSGS